MEYGQIFATAGVAAAMEESERFTAEIAAAFTRYQRRDWGQLCQEDWQLNDDSLRGGSRILAAYDTSCGMIWIITEAEGDDGHRSATTFLFPSEY